MSALTDLFTSIANAIRTKKGTAHSIIASNFPSEILSIPTSGNTENYFKESIAPTYWENAIQTGTEYSTSDNYGMWRIVADSQDGRYVKNAFGPAKNLEGQFNSACWVSYDLQTHGETSAAIEIDFPIQICPTEVTIRPTSSFASNEMTAHIYFSQTTSDDDWELLAENNDARSIYLNTTAISTSTYYRRMKIVTDRGNETKVGYHVVQISKGYWKEVE